MPKDAPGDGLERGLERSAREHGEKMCTITYQDVPRIPTHLMDPNGC